MGCTLIATGDLAPQRPTPGLAELWPALGGADLVFANLEAALTTAEAAADKMVCLRADPALAAELAGAGIHAVTVANNHTMDYGPDGLRDTLAATRGARLGTVGGGEDLDAAFRPAVLERGGVRIAVLGMASTLPNGSGAGPTRPGVAPVRVLSRFVVDPVSIDEDPGMAPFVETQVMPGDGERAAEAVGAAKAQADVVVVAIHWGVPNGWVMEAQGELATYQQPLARLLVEAGADAIIGHHPHVLHGVELIDGRPVFYSLGNLLFHTLLDTAPRLGRPYPPYSWASLRGDVNHLGGVARLEWERPGPPSRVALAPVWLDEHGDPVAATGAKAEAARERVARLSEKFGTRWTQDGERMEVARG
jgi:poly-gamma-glutamate capsule biosynthesis protein CapA/YwtB (metallophosphatase superfamily)